MARHSFAHAATTVAAACLALHAGLGAQPATTLYSPVILLYDGLSEYSGSSAGDVGHIQMRDDGSGFTYFSWPGPPDVHALDLTHSGTAGHRYLLAQRVSSEQTPEGYNYCDLVAFREDGDSATLRVLTLGTTTNVDRNCTTATWSTDGKRVFHSGRRWQNGTVVESGVYIAEVESDGSGAPVALKDERLVVADDPATGIYADGGATLASDGMRLVYGREHHYQDANNQLRIEPLGLFMTTVPRPDPVGNLLPAGPEVPLGITGGSVAFSTARGDSRLAYAVASTNSRSVGLVLHIAAVPPGYDGSAPLKVVYAGTKEFTRLSDLNWSPDGEYLLFVTADKANLFSRHVWKMRSNGSGKVVRLTPSADFYTILGWRR